MHMLSLYRTGPVLSHVTNFKYYYLFLKYLKPKHIYQIHTHPVYIIYYKLFERLLTDGEENELLQHEVACNLPKRWKVHLAIYAVYF